MTRMILVIGEILFDIFPNYNRIGGASFNFAFHLNKLKFPVKFVSRVGNDAHGRDILAFLEKHDFDSHYIQIDPVHKTGYVSIKTGPGSDHSFTIVKDTAYDHIAYDTQLSGLINSQPRVFYFGTLIQRAKFNVNLLQKILARLTKKTTVFCDINLRPMCYSDQTIATALKAADMLKLNHEELLKITGPAEPSPSYPEMVNQLMKTHALEVVILTLGRHGSHWATPARTYFSPTIKKRRIIDTVGAGDAYAAMSVAGWLSGLPHEKTILLATEFSSYICGIKGALPEDGKIYRHFIKKGIKHV